MSWNRPETVKSNPPLGSAPSPSARKSANITAACGAVGASFSTPILTLPWTSKHCQLEGSAAAVSEVDELSNVIASKSPIGWVALWYGRQSNVKALDQTSMSSCRTCLLQN